MNILIIDDDTYKIDAVVSGIKQYFNQITINISVRDNVEDGFNYILSNTDNINLIVLDMRFPLNHREYKVVSDAGFQLLNKMKEQNINISVVLNTSDNYYLKILHRHYPVIIDYIHYDYQDNLYNELLNSLNTITK